MPQPIPEIILPHLNKTYNQLTITNFCYRRSNSRKVVMVKCSCGNEKAIEFDNVIRGLTKSCGCLYKGNKNAQKICE